MKIKEMYETLFEYDETEIDLTQLDDSAFGFDLDSNKSAIGYFYIFLMTIYNLIPVRMDKTPIIDNKGQINGYVHYSIDFKILEPFGSNNEITDLIDYDSLSDPELMGKKLLVNFQIKEGDGLPK